LAQHVRAKSDRRRRSLAYVRAWWPLGTILILAALIRGSYLTEIARSPGFGFHTVDARFHDYWARGLITGDWTPPPQYRDPLLQQRPYLRPPGYPYFLAAVYRVAGTSPYAPTIAQMMLGLASCLLGYLLARRWFGQGVGLVFALLMGTYWSFIYYETKLHAAALLIFLAMALLNVLALWAERITIRRAMAAGVLVGLFALVRPTILPFAVIALLWGLWLARRQGQVRTSVLPTIVYVAAIAMTIAPATVRNYLVARDFVLVSSNGGINLYIGNNPAARGHFTDNFTEMRNINTCFDLPILASRVEQQAGRPLRDSQVSHYFAGKAVAYMRQHPLRTVALLSRKLLLFWGPKEISLSEMPHFDRSQSRVLTPLPNNFAMVMALAIIGLVLLGLHLRPTTSTGKSDTPAKTIILEQQTQVGVLVLLFLVCYSGAFLPFFVTALYRQPVIPLLLLLGAFALYRVGCLVWTRRYALAGAVVAGGCAAFAVCSINFAGYEPDEAEWHYRRALALEQAGRTNKAVAEYQAAIGLKPHHVSAHHNLGVICARQDKLDLAVAHYRRALEADPEAPDVHNDLGIALQRSGRRDQAMQHYREALRIDPDYADAHVNLGQLLVEQGQNVEGIDHFHKALALNPRHREAHHNLGLALARQNDFAGAAEQFRQVTQIDPNWPVGWRFLGNALLGGGRAEEAVEPYRRALAIRPDYAEAHDNLAVALATLGQTDEAMFHFSEAVRLRPDFESARQRLEALRSTLRKPQSRLSPGNE